MINKLWEIGIMEKYFWLTQQNWVNNLARFRNYTGCPKVLNSYKADSLPLAWLKALKFRLCVGHWNEWMWLFNMAVLPNQVAASEALRLNWDSRNLGPNVDMPAIRVASVAPAKHRKINVGFFSRSNTDLEGGWRKIEKGWLSCGH